MKVESTDHQAPCAGARVRVQARGDWRLAYTY